MDSSFLCAGRADPTPGGTPILPWDARRGWTGLFGGKQGVHLEKVAGRDDTRRGGPMWPPGL